MVTNTYILMWNHYSPNGSHNIKTNISKLCNFKMFEKTNFEKTLTHVRKLPSRSTINSTKSKMMLV